MSPIAIFNTVPLPVIHHFEACYYLKNGKTIMYLNPEMQRKYGGGGNDLLDLLRDLS